MPLEMTPILGKLQLWQVEVHIELFNSQEARRCVMCFVIHNVHSGLKKNSRAQHVVSGAPEETPLQVEVCLLSFLFYIARVHNMLGVSLELSTEYRECKTKTNVFM